MPLITDRFGHLAVMLLGLAAMVLTIGFVPESAIFPRIVAGIIAAMGGLHLLGSFLRPPPADELIEDASGGYQLDSSAGLFDSPARFAIIFVFSVAYCISIAAIGYYTATLIFIPLSLLALGYRSPVGLVAATLGFIAVTWLVIGVLFSRVLPPERILQLFG